MIKSVEKKDVGQEEKTTVNTYETAEYRLTDIGNAENFINEHSHNTRFCMDTKMWLSYKDGVFVDSEELILRKAQGTVKGLYDKAQEEDLPLRKKEEILKHAKRSSTPGKIKALLELARYNEEIMVRAHELDSDPWLLNCRNGTLDLRTNELKSHSIEDFLTKQCPIHYNADAKCPAWDEFLKQIMNNSQEKIDFLQRIFGYALTGMVNEQCLFIFYGAGANGKSTMVETIRQILGNYTMHTSSRTILTQNFSSIRNDLARLSEPRLLSADEIPMGKKLDETLIKQITGGEPVSSRFLYREIFEYKPSFKLFLTTNYKPQIRGVDEGIWRRIHLFPFDFSIPDDRVDKELPSKFRAELQGILAWMVKGCSEWRARGLDVPDEIKRATAAYRKEMDLLDGFFEDVCVIGSGNRISLADLYSTYLSWADQVCQDPVGRNEFGTLMKKRGFLQSKSGSVRFWVGLKKK